MMINDKMQSHISDESLLILFNGTLKIIIVNL